MHGPAMHRGRVVEGPARVQAAADGAAELADPVGRQEAPQVVLEQPLVLVESGTQVDALPARERDLVVLLEFHAAAVEAQQAAGQELADPLEAGVLRMVVAVVEVVEQRALVDLRPGAQPAQDARHAVGDDEFPALQTVVAGAAGVRVVDDQELPTLPVADDGQEPAVDAPGEVLAVLPVETGDEPRGLLRRRSSVGLADGSQHRDAEGPVAQHRALAAQDEAGRLVPRKEGRLPWDRTAGRARRGRDSQETAGSSRTHRSIIAFGTPDGPPPYLV